MRKLKVVYVTRVAALCHGYDMVNTRGQRMRIPLGEIDRLAADTTTGLRCVYSFLVPVKGLAVGAVFVRSVAFVGCHAVTPPVA
jgi:hypothetical protein